MSYDSPEPNKEALRAQLKDEIRQGLSKFPEFTPTVIDKFLATIEAMEQSLREKLNPTTELLCREIVEPLLQFIGHHSLFQVGLQRFGPQKSMDSLLMAFSCANELLAEEQKQQQRAEENMRRKFSALQGVTSDQVCRLVSSIQHVLIDQKQEPTDDVMQPFLNIDNAELQAAIDQRGVDRVFPELVTSFYRHVQKIIAQSN